jgi:exodeoxyribonuclease VII large subunit
VRDLERALGRAARAPVGRAELQASHLEQRLLRSGERVADCARRLESVRGRAGAAARLRVMAARRETRDVTARLGRLAPRAVESRRALPAALARRIASRALDRVRRDAARVTALDRLAAELRPQRTLQRGFSITRDAAGTLVRDARRVAPGARLTTELGRGAIESTVDLAVPGAEEDAATADPASSGEERA